MQDFCFRQDQIGKRSIAVSRVTKFEETSRLLLSWRPRPTKHIRFQEKKDFFKIKARVHYCQRKAKRNDTMFESQKQETMNIQKIFHRLWQVDSLALLWFLICKTVGAQTHRNCCSESICCAEASFCTSLQCFTVD